MDRQVKLAVKHKRGCRAVQLFKEGILDTPWGPIAYGLRGEPVIKTWRRYGKNGSVLKKWVRVMCQSTDCKAELHVDEEFIIAHATKLAL